MSKGDKSSNTHIMAVSYIVDIDNEYDEVKCSCGYSAIIGYADGISKELEIPMVKMLHLQDVLAYHLGIAIY